MTHAMTETTTPLPVAAPCEHCGSTDIFIEREDLSAYQARCNDCGSRGPIVEEGRYYDNEEAGQRDAIAAWNKRAAPPAPSASPAASTEALTEAAAVAALKEVMEWISNWAPSFIFDDEWPATKAKVDAAIRARGEG